MIAARLSSGTKRGYKTAVKYWIRYTDELGVSKFTDDPEVYIGFLITRFMEHNVGKISIQGDFSAINDFRVRNGIKPIIWSEKIWQLPYFYQVIDRCHPPGKGSLPNDEAFTLHV